MIERDLNNFEKQSLKAIKEKGFAYELKFINNSWYANVPALITTFCLNSKIKI